MIDADVEIEFDEQKTDWLPGERLAGRYRLSGDDARNMERLEVSVLWYTSGKGDEDLEVHSFEEFRAELPTWTSPLDWRPFGCVLPQTPLSYDGVLLKIHWCVRIRYYPPGGQQVVGEASFRLGNVGAGEPLQK